MGIPSGWAVVCDGASPSLNFPISFECERRKRGTEGPREAAQGMMRDGEAVGEDWEF